MNIKLHQEWVNTILEEGETKLNDWERTFITDMEYKLGENRSLTERQAAVLEKIFKKVTGTNE